MTCCHSELKSSTIGRREKSAATQLSAAFRGGRAVVGRALQRAGQRRQRRAELMLDRWLQPVVCSVIPLSLVHPASTSTAGALGAP